MSAADADLPAGRFLFASESVTQGHPDKLCDRVADAVLDACLAQDPDSRVACEAVAKSNMVMVLGEVATKATVNYEQVVREATRAVGYDSDEKGMDSRTMNVIVALEEQSPDLAQGVGSAKGPEEAGTWDHGVVFGYSTDESEELMPVSHLLASRLCARLDQARGDGSLVWARPGGRAQVTLEYREESDGSVAPTRIHSVIVSAQSSSDVKPDKVESDLMDQVVKPVLPEGLCDAKTQYIFPEYVRVDTGLSGRRSVADTYGGWGSHGGAGLSGRDASRVSRCGTYAARWAARSLVASRLCRRCLVQLSWPPSTSQPACLSVNSYGTAAARGGTDAELAGVLLKNFDFRLGCLQKELGLNQPWFQKLSAHGHLGRKDIDQCAWEKPKELK